MTTDALGNEIGKLFVGGLHQNTNNDDLKAYFSKFGEVADAIVMMDNCTQRSRGFGYVKFVDALSVDKVMSASPHILNEKEIDPKQCNVNMKGKNRRSLKIFVGGIAPEVNEEAVKEFFSQYGNVTDVNLMIDPTKQRHRGFAFVGFDEEEVVKRLIAQHYVTISGKQVEMKAMEPPNSRRTVGLTGPLGAAPGGLLTANHFIGNPTFGGMNMTGRGPPHPFHLRGGPGDMGHAQSTAHRFMASAQQGNPLFFGGAGGPGPANPHHHHHHPAAGPNTDYNSAAALNASMAAANLWGQHSLWTSEHTGGYSNPQANMGNPWESTVNNTSGAPGGQNNQFAQQLINNYLAASNCGMLPMDFGLANSASSNAAGQPGHMGAPGSYPQPATNGAMHHAHQHGAPGGSWSSWTNPSSLSHGSGPGVGMGVQPNNPSANLNGPQGGPHQHQSFSYNASMAGMGAGNPPANIAAYTR